MTLTGFVLLYIAATIAIGVIAATRVKNTSDFALAGRSFRCLWSLRQLLRHGSAQKRFLGFLDASLKAELPE